MIKYEIDKSKKYLLEHESGRIYTTRKYEEFKRLKGNRSVEPQRWLSIVKSIKDSGYIQSPIVVNEKFEVIDGQGRLKALEHLEMPVEFVISPGAGIKQCISMNIAGNNWKDPDFIDSYVDLGYPGYIKLKELMTEFDVKHSVIGTALFKVSKINSSVLREGKIVVTDEEYDGARKNMERAKYLFQYFDIKSNKIQPQVLYQSLLYVIMMPDINQERLDFVISEGVKLPRIRSFKIDDLLDAIECAYNYGLRQEKKVSVVSNYQRLMKDNSKRGINKVNKRNKEKQS